MVRTEEESTDAWKTNYIFDVIDFAETNTSISQGKLITEVTKHVVADTSTTAPVSDVIEHANGEDYVADKNMEYVDIPTEAYSVTAEILSGRV